MPDISFLYSMHVSYMRRHSYVKYAFFKLQLITFYFATRNVEGNVVSQINGTDVRVAKHQEVVMLLITPGNEIVLDVRHDPPPTGLRVGGATSLYNASGILRLRKVITEQLAFIIDIYST